MALSNQEIVDALKEKTLLEASELVKMLEEAFGVS
ncbi:MAG: 50S ribosomal protein L7/L12, partial [Pyrinomonadaceae bacterium]